MYMYVAFYLYWLLSTLVFVFGAQKRLCKMTQNVNVLNLNLVLLARKE